MAFFKAIKRSLGIGPDREYEELLDSLAAEVPQQPPAMPHTQDDMPDVEIDPAAAEKALMQQRIFDSVVRIFNEALPDFLRRSVNPHIQSKYIYDSLDRAVKDYIATLAAAAQEECRQRWENKNENLNREMEALRARTVEVEKQRADMEHQQLTANREKKALTDRILDLEERIKRFEADRKQLEMENRALANKIKVAETLGPMPADVAPATQPTPDELAELAELRAKMPEMERAMAEAAEQARTANEIAEDRRRRLLEAGKNLRITEEELEQAQKSLEDIKEQVRKADESESIITDRDTQIKDLRKEIKAREKEIISLRTTIAENLRQQGVREREFRARIEKLKNKSAPAEKTSADEKPATAMQTADPSTPPAPSAAKADSVSNAAISPIPDLAEDNAADEPIAQQPPESRPVRRRGRPPKKNVNPSPAPDSQVNDDNALPKISDNDLDAIEKTFESEEWFTAQPPVETPSMRHEGESDTFGYTPPKRRNRPNNDNSAQLSLF